MKISSVSHTGIAKVLLILTTASILIVFLASWRGTPTSAQSTGPSTPAAPVQPTLAPDQASLRQTWRTAVAQIPLPRKGCFQSSYPTLQWQQVSCVTAPLYPQLPRRGPRPIIVGNGNSVSPRVPSGLISTAIGSFDTVTGVTSETGQINATGAQITDAYTLQLNTNFFTSTACAGSPNPSCQGWEQFVFANDGTSGSVFIQYWLLSYNAACPTVPAPGAAWIQVSLSGSTDIYCFKNSLNASSVPDQPISNLINLSLSGTVSTSGDSFTFSTGGTVYSATGENAVSAAAGWDTAEFTVVGDAGGGQANFNPGSTIVSRARVIYGGNAAPICVVQGFTGETNNLSFGPTAPVSSQPGPALLYTESSAGGATSDCAAAQGVGDTHLTTFNGLAYDFQATGDFLLAQRGPDFVVQTRQVSGAPTWPDAAVNNAVATQMGKTQVAICLEPARLNVDGKTTDLEDGKSLSLPDGVDVSRTGNVYLITGQSGDSVRAVVNASYIDVHVGLGVWPDNVSGLLANPKGDPNLIQTRDGTVFANPFSFEELYGPYANSWRVKPSESILTSCGEVKELGVPKKPFYASNLQETNQKAYDNARSICMKTGVKEGALLDACIIDVAVIGPVAAQIYTDATAPIVVGVVK